MVCPKNNLQTEYFFKRMIILAASNHKKCLMNFLAHAYLSFNNDDILVGNVMGDFVKGNQKNNFPAGIKKGIELHRFIDSFTDVHPVFLRASKMVKPAVGLYSGAFVDIMFDYFLANDTHKKTEQEWKDFAQQAYQTLSRQQRYFPAAFAAVFPNMRRHDWLYNYRFPESIDGCFRNLVRRAKYLFLSNADSVMTIFKENIPQFKNCYNEFFPDLEKEVKENFSRFAE